MYLQTVFVTGLIATANTFVLIRGPIERCLADAGVPFDTKGSPEYARNSAAFNLRLPYIPAAIAFPLTTRHIQDSVNCGRKLGIKVSAKSGGHSYASFGFGGEDGHLMLELDSMHNVSYDVASNIATIQPGARLGHVASVLHDEYGRSFSHGTCPGVGISGHVLHGGFGFSSHMHGLALDFVESVTVVLANGSIVEASKTETPDLLWGIQGSGSNFGIVALWKLRTFAAPTFLTKFGVDLGWNRRTAVAGLEAIENYVKNMMPREVNFRVGDYKNGEPEIEGLYYGTPEEWRKDFQPLLDALPQTYRVTRPEALTWIETVISYSNQKDVDWLHDGPQENFYAKSLTLKGLNGTSAQDFVDYYYNTAIHIRDRFWYFQLDIHGGANSQIAKVTQNATSYVHRDKLYIIQWYERYENNQIYPETSFSFLDGWVEATKRSLPERDWGAYANYADPRLERGEAEKQYYGEHLERLKRLKAEYDPEELFYYPQGVSPAKL